MSRRGLVLLPLFVCLLAHSARSAAPQAPPASAFDPVGLQPSRGYFSQLPFEAVDMVNGHLTLRFTDLVLPGNAGLDLRLTRTYNRDAWGGAWFFGFTDVPVRVASPVAPPPPPPGEQQDPWKPWLIMGDGSSRELNADVLPGVFVTDDFWKYDPDARTLCLPNGWVATYEPTGNPSGGIMLVEVHDPYGNAITPFWNDTLGGIRPFLLDHVVQTVNDDGGLRSRTVYFSYTGNNPRLPSSMSYEDRTWAYTYGWLVPGTATYNLTGVQPPEGSGWTFGYTQAGFAGTVEVTLPTGGTVTYTFVDAQDLGAGTKLTQITTGGRAITSGTWTFDVAGGQGVVTMPGGRVLRYVHSYQANWSATPWVLVEKTLLEGGAPVASLTRTYTDIDFVPSYPLKAPAQQVITQGGETFTTSYEYSGSHFGDHLQPNRLVESSSTTAETRITTRTYTYDFGPYIAARPASETVAVNGESFTTDYSYSAATGFLTSATRAGVPTTYAPDSVGNTASVTDAGGHQTTLGFQWGVPGSVTTPASAITRTLNPDGTVATETRGGVTTGFRYDGLGRVTQVEPAEGAATTTSYAADGSSVTVSRGPVWTTTTLDGFGRPTATENSAGVRTTMTYDREGFKTFQSYPVSGGSGGGDTFTYDALGRVTTISHADSSWISYAYAGTDVAITDENGRTTTQYWTAFGDPGDGRLVGLVDAKGASWSYTYNALGSLTSVHAPAGPDRVWAYDDKNRLVSDTQPESGTTTYTYTTEGLLASKTDAAGRTTGYAYDGNHRLIGIDAPGTADDATFTYDARDNRVRAAAGTVDSVFSYDAANRLVAREDRIQGQIFITGFTYDARDNLTTITYPSGRAAQYEYDGADRISRVFAASQTYADQISYHPSGAIAGYTLGNGTHETVTFDARNRPAHLTSGPLDVTYAYDAVGNVSSVTDARPSYSATYGYDELDRLTDVLGFGTTTFTYDALGNRLTKGGGASLVTYAYSGTTHRLLSATSPVGYPETGTFTYDAVGNMTGDGTGTYTYTARNQMASATVAGLTTTYTYDADGLRVQKSSAAGQDYFVHGLGSQLLAEYAALFVKTAPLSGSSGSQTTVTLTWTPVANATYEVCWDTTGNSTCDGTWTATGAAATRTLTDLSPGTYYWQVRATTATGTAEADNGAWWTFTVAPGGFMKLGPVDGVTGLTTVTLQWHAVAGDPSYSFCFDTTDNDSCDTMWWPNGGSTSVYWDNLAPGTYYWQARVQLPSGQVFDADGGTWWRFTIGGGGAGFGKQTPAPGLSGLPTTVRVQWTPVPNEGYWVCWDTIDNGQCDTMWWPNGGQTWKDLENLAPGTYYWQVKTSDVPMEADGGLWWPLTVGTPPVTFGKQTPAAGAILTANAAMLWWDAAAGGQYYEVCVDTVNNGVCDTSWQLNGVATSRQLAGLTDGTYYWQVRAQTANGPLYADNAAWWSVTIDAPDPIREYVYLGNTLLASLTLTTGTPVLTYYHTDVLGSVRAITDANGATVSRQDYFPFGESTALLTGDPRRFTGKERDPETAFDYFDARYYRNVWGRFTTVDPVVNTTAAALNPQRWNRYAYAADNPLRFLDPDGRDIRDVIIHISGPNPVPTAPLQELGGRTTEDLGILPTADGAYLRLAAEIIFDKGDDLSRLKPERVAFQRVIFPGGRVETWPRSGRGEDPSNEKGREEYNVKGNSLFIFDAPGLGIQSNHPLIALTCRFQSVYSIKVGKQTIFFKVHFNIVAGEIVEQSIDVGRITEAEYKAARGNG
jgi:RHS repeat-associated protein